MLQFVLLLIGSYLLGSVPSAYIVSKWCCGVDIRQYGSGNVGASNVLAVVSKWWSIPVSIFDLGKGILPIVVARLLGFPVSQQVMVGLAAIIGHNWPVFLRFSGGRGIMASLGMVLILTPKLALVELVFAFLWYPFGLLPLGALIAITSLPVLTWFAGGPFDVERSLPLSLGFAAMLIIAIIRRLTAPKTQFTEKVSRKELIFYRLVFDRDIRDKKTWVNRNVPAKKQLLPSPEKDQDR